MADQQLGEFQSQVLKDERTYAVPTASGGAAVVKHFDDGSIPGAGTAVATGAVVFNGALTTAHYVDKGLTPFNAASLGVPVTLHSIPFPWVKNVYACVFKVFCIPRCHREVFDEGYGCNLVVAIVNHFAAHFLLCLKFAADFRCCGIIV